MIRSVVALALVAVMLGGCILQSRAPVYTDEQSTLALGDKGGTAISSSWKDGAWVPEADKIAIQVVGAHYEAVSNSSTVVLNFVPLDGPWFVIQAKEGDLPAAYLLAKVNGRAAEAYPLACKDLKADNSLAAWIDFDGDDCYVKTSAPADMLFKQLAASPRDPTSKLEIIP